MKTRKYRPAKLVSQDPGDTHSMYSRAESYGVPAKIHRDEQSKEVFFGLCRDNAEARAADKQRQRDEKASGLNLDYVRMVLDANPGMSLNTAKALSMIGTQMKRSKERDVPVPNEVRRLNLT